MLSNHLLLLKRALELLIPNQISPFKMAMILRVIIEQRCL